MRLDGGGNKHHFGSPCGFPGTHPSKDRQRTNNRRINRDTSIDKWECGVRGVKPLRMPTRTPRTNIDGRGVNGTDRIRICVSA